VALRTRLLLALVDGRRWWSTAATLVLARAHPRAAASSRRAPTSACASQALGVIKWLDRADHPERLAPRLGGVVNARVTIIDGDGVDRVGDSERPADVGLAVGRRAGDARRPGGPAGGPRDPHAAARRPAGLPGGDASRPIGRVIRLAVPMPGSSRDPPRRCAGSLALAALVGLVVALGLGAVLAIRAIVRAAADDDRGRGAGRPRRLRDRPAGRVAPTSWACCRGRWSGWPARCRRRSAR
jgi:hypothetical protein